MKLFLKSFFTFALMIYFTSDSFGFARKKINLVKGVVSISVPKEWQTVRDLFGVPLTILGPSSNGARPVVSFTPTGLEDLKFDSKSLEQNQEEYKAGRESWLRSKDGKSLQYFPYKFERRKDAVEIHQIGYAYELNDIRYTEYSYYILCDRKLFHAKTLLSQTHEKLYEKIIKEMIGSFECK